MSHPGIYIDGDGNIFRPGVNEREANAEIYKCYDLDDEQTLRLLIASGLVKSDHRSSAPRRANVIANNGQVMNDW